MAGSYSDYISNRMAYDTDRTAVYVVDFIGASTRLLSSAEVADLNWYHPDALSAADRQKAIAFVFPEPRTVTSICAHTDGGGTFQVSTSQVATNLASPGTWTTKAVLDLSSSVDIKVASREVLDYTPGSCKSLLISDIGATSALASLSFIHLFGDSDVSTDRLEIWDPVVDERISPTAFDYGDVPRGSSEDRWFRVANLSDSLIASAITVGAISEDASVDAQLLFSTDGRSFYYASVDLGSLAPQSASTPIAVRRVQAPDAPLGMWAFSVAASASSWI